MRIIRNLADLPTVYQGALIPTMGALHEGHFALIRSAARTSHRPIVVSIFVNPTQFAPGEDFECYPRKYEEDYEIAQAAGAEIIFAPSAEAIYPPKTQIPIPSLPGVAKEPALEDASRPGHFAGVCQVVARLFDLVMPGCVVFGEKDYQQLLVIKAMVEQEGERWSGLEIIAHETIREPGGLAMSSRNVNLPPDFRSRATGLSRALQKACQASRPSEGEEAMRRILADHELKIDYAVVRDAKTLLPVETLEKPTRALIAARLGNVRLIDNMEIPACE